MLTSPVIFLIDNGSLRAEATLELRCLASKLSTRIGKPVLPVSLLHSSKIEAVKLFGKRAQTLKPTLRKWIQTGERAFIFLPLFLGPSRAITEYLPKLINEAREQAPDLKVSVAPPLAGRTPEVPDVRLSKILATHVRRTLQRHHPEAAKIALVDHGTPEILVNQVRNAVANQLCDLLQADVTSVAACSMERRPGVEYDFNEPLLESLGSIEGWRNSDLVVAMFFLLPGRHAGPGGDVAAICDHLAEQSLFHSILKTPLLCKHPQLIEILEDRLDEALKSLWRFCST